MHVKPVISSESSSISSGKGGCTRDGKGKRPKHVCEFLVQVCNNNATSVAFLLTPLQKVITSIEYNHKAGYMYNVRYVPHHHTAVARGSLS